MFAGNDLVSGAVRSDSGAAYLTLTDWSQRAGAGQDVKTLTGTIRDRLSKIDEAKFFTFAPPVIDGLGDVGGFEAHILDRGGAGTAALMGIADSFVAAANKLPELEDVETTLQADIPRFDVEVDRAQATALGIGISQVFDAVQATFGTLYVNDFTLYGHNYHVDVQSDTVFRQDPDGLKRIFLRATGGAMVPLAPVVKLKRRVEADLLQRFQVYQ